MLLKKLSDGFEYFLNLKYLKPMLHTAEPTECQKRLTILAYGLAK